MKVPSHRAYRSYQPIYMIGSIVFGVCLGLFFKNTAKQLSVFADMYLSLLRMCLIPFILTAIPVALSRIIKMKIAKRLFIRLVVAYVLTSLVVAIFGVGCGFIAHGLNPIKHSSLETLGGLIMNQSPISSSAALNSGVTTFLKDLVPNNVFTAMTDGRGIQVLVFSVFLGCGLGFLALDVANPAIRVCRGIYKTFVIVVSGILAVLPLGLFFLIGAYIANFPITVWETLRTMVLANLIGLLMVAFVLLAILSSWLNKSIYYSLVKLKSVFLVSLFSFSGFVVLPLVLRLFGRNFDLDEEEVSLFYPLGVALHPLGSVFLFSIFSVFIMNIYGHHTTILDVLKIVVFSLVASIPMGGLYYKIPKGMLYIAMSILLHPMGLPASTAVLLLLAGQALFLPAVNLVNVIGNCLTVALIVRRRSKVSPVAPQLEEASL